VGPDEAGGVLADVSLLAPELGEVIRYVHDPLAAPESQRELVSIVSLANEFAHLTGMTFFRGTADTEVVVTGLPAWQLLSRSYPKMSGWDVARLGFELEKESRASESFMRVSR
jgi:hypothetical protein